VASKRVKIFKKRQNCFPSLIYDDEEVQKEGITRVEIEDEDEGETSIDNLVTMLIVKTCDISFSKSMIGIKLRNRVHTTRGSNEDENGMIKGSGRGDIKMYITKSSEHVGHIIEDANKI
jgi:hypothetical protein